MNELISFTPVQLLGLIVSICAGISCVGGAIVVLSNWKKDLNAPEAKQNERLTALEERVSRYDEFFAKDNRRLEALEDGNRIIQRAILALLSHGIDGNDIESMKESKKELQEFLIKR